MKRIFLLFILGLVSQIGFAENINKKTNVVLILIDDLSHYGVSAYGSKLVSSNDGLFKNVPISTPRIDNLAQTGMMCNRAFAYPLCEPTRISLMTGKYNSRNFLRCKSQHESDITFGDIFQKEGYSTGIFGKWKQTRGTKEVHGKDYIFNFGWDEFCCFDVITEGQRFINPNLVINGEIKNYNGRTDLDPETGRRWYGPDICNRHALKFIEKNKDKPFFLYYPMLLVHDDHKPTPDTKPNSIFDNFDEANNNKNGHSGDNRLYFPDMISYMDKLIGRVVDKLDELGLRENTLIIVMGDNGTKECFTHVLPNGTLYPGRKGGNMDNGIHVPLVINQLNKIKKSEDKIRTYDGLVDVTDIYPTILNAVNINIPKKETIDGISFWPQVLGKKGEARKVIYTWYNGNNPYTNEEDLLIYAFDKNFKRYAPSKEYPEGRFFDLREDPLEQKGDKVFERGWKLMLYSGLDLKKLTSEQKSAYTRLGNVIDSHKYIPVNALKILNSTSKLQVGSIHKLDYKILPTNATRNSIIWESDNPEIASVNKFGELNALKKGTATISIYSWDDAYPVSANENITYSKSGIKTSIKINIE